MHENEVPTDADQVRRLVAAQFPQWAGLPVTPVTHTGTDHALYRLGDDLVARLPRIDWALDQVDSDQRWLPRLAPHLPLAVPATLAVGEPGEGYPWRWSVVPWLPGENPTSDNLDMDAAAVDLARFVTALHAVDPMGGPVKTGTYRGVPLAARDGLTRSAIEELGDRIDAPRLTAAWERALAAPVWDGPPVWIHGDLQAGNLLAHERRLSAVIDFGALGLGDPAVDLMPAWNLFYDPAARATFRAAAGYDDAAWERSKGWALSTALVGLPYYWDTAPEFIAEAWQKIDAVLRE
ncbi:hypothetical protein GCM10009682_42920 [Luedemannella flava]|uniref:Aminoglycoside phosphotransferase domain-containing protein n=1 Tax=Luedemannella flava TaxID=349316 RepID=A0ABP4YHW6_9ACTN